MATKRVVLPLLLCLLSFSALVFAQTTGSIRGDITDSDGKALPGVTVTISSDALLGQSRTAYTNESGIYRFASLPVGVYALEATMESFQKVRVEKVSVSIDATATVPLRMDMMKLAETVTTIGESPIIDVTDSGLSTNYKGELLDELPTQHQMTDLMQVTPGVTASTGDSGGDRTIALGSNMQSNAWHVDGVDLSAPETGSVWFTVNPDLIEEIQVTGVGASAEYGNHTGAVFNVVTKKGGNELHGGANYYFLNDDLTDTNVELEGVDPAIAGFHRTEYRRISASLGGPIMKDKVWFFGGVETLRDAAAQPGVDPVFADQAPYKSDKYDIKVTGRIGENHEVSGFGHYENWDSPNLPSPQYADLSALAGEGGTNPAWGGSLTSTLSQNFLLEVGYSGWWSDDIYDSVIGTPPTDPFIDYTPPGGGPTQYSGGVWYPWDYETWRSQFKAKATHYAENFLGSEHDFKFGVQYSLGAANTSIAIGANGFYTYNYDYYGTGYQYLYRVYQNPFQYGADNRELGMFVDDTITVNDWLTLNAGIRFDRNTGTVPEYDRLIAGTPSIAKAGNFKTTGEKIPGLDVIDWNTWSPRVGFVIQPTKDGRSTIQGSFGVYYDHNVSGNWDYPPPQVPDIIYTFFNSETGQFEEYDRIVSDDIVPNTNLRPPRALQYSVGYDQQFGKSVAAGVQYVYKTTKDLIGWQILGGTYETVQFTDPFTGRVYDLLSIVDRPTLTKGHDPGDFPGSEGLSYHQKYHGLLFTFEKRFGDKWGVNANYTWSRSEGLNPRALEQTQFNPFYGSRNGSDPNNWINAEGHLQGDRPHMFRFQAVFMQLPGDLQASVAADFESGRHHTRQIRTPTSLLNQGGVVIIMERDLRLKPIKAVDVSVGRRFHFGENVAVRLEGTVYNILNADNELNLATQRLQNVGEEFTPDFWTQPRRLQVRLGFEF